MDMDKEDAELLRNYLGVIYKELTGFRKELDWMTKVIGYASITIVIIKNRVGLVIRFLSIGPRLCSTLPSDPASQQRLALH